MLYGGGLVALLLLIFWIYCILDVISTDDVLVRNMPKLVWLLVVIVIPTVGSVAWLVLGRPQKAGYVLGDTTRRPPQRMVGPEDSPAFMSGLDDRSRELKKWEDDLRRREEELRRREEDG